MDNCRIRPYTKSDFKIVVLGLLGNIKQITPDEIALKIIESSEKLGMKLPIKNVVTDFSEIIVSFYNNITNMIDNAKKISDEDKLLLKQLIKEKLESIKNSLFDKLGVPENNGTPINTPEESKNTTDLDNKPLKILKEKARVILKRIFGTSLGPLNYWESKFSQDIFKFVCVGDTLITNNDELNKAIAIQKNKYYKDIRQYLLKKGYTIVENFPESIFANDGTLNSGFEFVLRLFEKSVISDLNKDKLRFGWADTLNDKDTDNRELLQSTLSYMNLRYFDTLLKYKVGKVLSISEDAEENIEQSVFSLKYLFASTINELSKGWETLENQDALENTARFSKMLIENIPMRSYLTKKELGYNITTTSFAFAFSNLFNTIVLNNKGNEKLTSYLYRMHSNPKKYIKLLLHELFYGRETTLKDKLLDGGLTEFDLNVLYSVGEAVFFRDDSFENVEINYIKDKSTPLIPSLYPLVECVTGVVDRMMGVNYLEYTVNDEGKLELIIKKKFNSLRGKYKLRNKIGQNFLTKTDELREIYNGKYDFKHIDKNIWEFSINDKKFRIVANANIFSDRDLKILSENGTEYNFDKLPDLNEIQNDTELRSIIQFILDSLQPIKVINSIEKLVLAQSLNKNLIKLMFISAARSGISNKIYNDYAKSKSSLLFKEWASLNVSELMETLNDNNIWKSQLGKQELSIIKTYDEWVDSFITAESILNGSIAKSTIKDITGNSIGNFSTSFLGGNIFYYLDLAKNLKMEEGLTSALSYLLGSVDLQFIQGIVINLDSSNQEKTERKLTKTMNISELTLQAIFHNFYGSYFGNDTKGKYIIQPTTYSDKTKFVQYIIAANRELGGDITTSYVGKTLHQLNKDQLVDLYADTVGKFYSGIFNNTVTKLKKTFGLADTATYRDVLVELDKLAKAYGKESERELINRASAVGVTLYLHSDYVINNNKEVQFNPLLDYYHNYLFKDKNHLHVKFNIEKIKFLNDIINSNNIFYIKRADGTTNTNIGDIIDELFENSKKNTFIISYLLKELGLPQNYDLKENEKKISFKLEFNKRWVKDNKLILARNNKTGKEYIYGDIIPSSILSFDLDVNPLLEHFFYTTSVLGNNLRLSLTGSELSHPIKWKKGIPNPINITKLSDYMSPIYDRMESITQGAQLKRNVIIPATLLYFQLNTLTGVPSKLKISVFRDEQASVFNYSGDLKNIDGSDGSGYSNSLITYIENRSLLDLNVGTIKKTIAHSPNYETGGAFLGKWAIFGITFENMHNSLISKVSLYDIDKRMLNILWYSPEGELTKHINKDRLKGEEIDLSQIISSSGKKNIKDSFKQDILQGRELRYRDPETGVIYDILDFGRDENGMYYTVEHIVLQGVVSLEGTRVYHLFDSNSEHIRLSKEEINNFTRQNTSYFIDNDSKELFHTINSNFELKESLGGIFSVHGNGTLYKYDDSATQATCQFLNLIAFREDSSKTRTFDLDDYYQPLKDAMIHYAVNNTAVKNGAGNINQESDWRTNSELKYMSVGYDGIGVQMDADHDADEALLTEFSLVISSLDANGNVHEKAKRVFESLLKISRQASITEIEALEQFILKLKENPDVRVRELSKIYDVVGRPIINNFKSNNESNLAEDVILAARKYFDKNLNHLQDTFKIPFSDPGIFSAILPVFASQINMKSVKRKYPGSGYVMCPGYNMREIFDIDGYTYQEADIVGLIKGTQGFLELYLRGKRESYSSWVKRISKEFLNNKLKILIEKSIKNGDYKNRFKFQPTENVLIRIYNKLTGEWETKQISLNNVNDYVTFTNNYWWKLIYKDSNINDILATYDIDNALFFKDITVGRNLAPQLISWKDASGQTHTIFEREEIRKGFTSHINITTNSGNLISIEVPSTYSKYDFDKLYLFVRDLGYDTNDISEFEIVKDHQDAADVLNLFEQINNKNLDGLEITDVVNKSSEVILSNMHRSKFPDKSLPYCLRNSEKVFKELPPITVAGLEKYLMALIDHNNRHAFVTFNEIITSDKESGNREKGFDDIRYQEEVLIPAYKKDNNVVPEKRGILIYSIDKDTSINQYPIGILKECSREEAYTERDGEEVLKEGYVSLNNKTFRQEYFVKKYIVPHKVKTKDNKDKTLYLHVYYINKDLINETFGKLASVGQILSKIYEQLDSKEIRLNINNDFSKGISASELNKILLNTNLLYEHENKLIDNIRTILSEIEKGQTEKINERYMGFIKTYYNSLSDIKRISFLRSLEVICSRIPAQSLQSFLKGQVVGFLDIPENLAYVSHWQLYLLGSDYDIDKSYIMGSAFSKHGLYYHWSPLFDFYSLNTLKASEEYIPISSSKIKLIPRNNPEPGTAIDISNFVERYIPIPTTEQLRIDNIKLFSEFINFLEDLKKNEIQVYVSNKELNKSQFVDKIKKHLEYEPTETSRENSIRNRILSEIMSVVSDLRNAVHAYSPIAMDDIQLDPENAKIMSLMNPLTVYRMLVENMVGKNVIGISAAAGEKTFFTLTYYWNESLRTKNLNNLYFVKSFKRIHGRYNEKLEINFDKLIHEIYEEGRKFKNDINKAFSNNKSGEISDEIINLFNTQGVLGSNYGLKLKDDINDIKNDSSLSNELKTQKINDYLNDEHKKYLTQIDKYVNNKIIVLRERGDYLFGDYYIDSLSNVNFAFNGISELQESFRKVAFIAEDIMALNKINTNDPQEFERELINRLKSELAEVSKADLYISLLLSAATDNAKELILALINCGSDLAGVYMYLLALGFDIKDIVAFMTSPAALCVHKLSETNMFNDDWKNLRIIDIVDTLLGNFNIIGQAYTKGKDGLELAVSEVKSGKLYNNDRFNLFIKTVINSLGNTYDIEEFYQDLIELKSILNSVKEHSNLSGIFLKLNQGLPTSLEDLLSKILRILNAFKDLFLLVINPSDFKKELLSEDKINLTVENIKNGKVTKEELINSSTFDKLVTLLQSRNEKLDREYIKNVLIKSIFEFHNVLGDPESVPIFFKFDARSWLVDEDYKKDTIDIYNIVKDTWNIFDVVDKVPQYKELINLLKLLYICNDQLSIKSRTLNKIHSKLLNRGKFLDEKSYKGLMDYVDDRIIYSFLTGELDDFNFKIPQGFGYLNREKIIQYNSADLSFGFHTNDDIANFKRFMEEYLIPNLMANSLDTENLFGKNVSFTNNKFIQGLTREISDDGVPFYKLDIDMFSLDSSGIETLIKYENMLTGLDELSKINYNGKSLAEWFLLYNLVVNKNKYGNDRMTTIFKSFINSNRSGKKLLNRFYNYISRLDYNSSEDIEKELGINYSDIELYIAPFVSRYGESRSKSEYIRLRNSDGSIIYKRRDKNGKYIELDLSVSRKLLLTVDLQQQEESERNSRLYYLRVNPNLDNYEYFKNKLRSKDSSEIFTALKLLEMNNILFVNINC